MKNYKSYFKIEDLFHVVSGKTSHLQDLSKGTTPFISSTEKNNGIATYVDEEPTFEGNKITVSRNGSVCEVFYQPLPFCASLDDIRVLSPKNFVLDSYVAMYLCTIIKKEKFRYTYGRKFGTTRIKETKIELPVAKSGEPDWVYIRKSIQDVLLKNETLKAVFNGTFNALPKIKNNFILNTKNWKVFKYAGENGVFNIKNGYYNKKPEQGELGNIPFIGATIYNNGVTGYFSLFDIENTQKSQGSIEHELNQKIFKGNCITVSNNGTDVGNAFYQDKDFTCSHDVNVLYLKGREWNKYIAMFICTLIHLEKYRWAYGRKWRPSRMPSSEIKLPVDKKGKPDFEFMENYIKSLPYSANI